MEKSDVIVRAVFGQVYSRLVLAATQNVFVFYNDLSPTVFGMQFCRLQKEQSDLIWDILLETMRTDAKAGRPPLAALYLSRKDGGKEPGAGFWSAYHNIYGSELSKDEWPKLVKEIWSSYSMQVNDHES